MNSTPQPQHEWLQRLVGEWTLESESRMAPDKPLETFKGTEAVRSLGGLWIIAEGEADMPGGTHGRSVMTLGFDSDTGRFVGTWIGTMMTNLWVYDGELNEDQTKLELLCDGPAMDGSGGKDRYRDVIEMTGENERTTRSSVLREDGSWQEFVTMRYRRKE